MKITGLSLFFFPLLMCGLLRASVSMTLEFGQFTTSQSVVLPAGSLWALISENSSGDLPGGMIINGALSVNTNQEAILSDFSGATIAPEQIIGGGVVLATGSSSSSRPGDISAFFQFEVADFAALGLNEGDKLGIYWFPGHTLASNTLPADSNFEIGGFHQASASGPSGGNAGMSVPPDGRSVTVAYYDSVTMGGATSFDPGLFQAVVVPEPSTMLLVSAGMLTVLRRRR